MNIAKNYEEHREGRKYIGTHIVADFWHCQVELDQQRALKLLSGAAKAANATVLGTVSHQFIPIGTTAIILLAESHISVHTWPEYNYVAVDIFTCGKDMDAKGALNYLKKILKPKKVELQKVRRGESAE